MKKSVLAGFVVSPLVPALLHGLLMGGVGAAIFAVVPAYLFSVVLGVPTFYLLRRMDWLELWQVLLGAALLGSMVVLVVVLISGGFEQSSVMSVLFGFCVLILYSIVTAAVFWWLAIGPLGNEARRAE